MCLCVFSVLGVIFYNCGCSISKNLTRRRRRRRALRAARRRRRALPPPAPRRPPRRLSSDNIIPTITLRFILHISSRIISIIITRPRAVSTAPSRYRGHCRHVDHHAGRCATTSPSRLRTFSAANSVPAVAAPRSAGGRARRAASVARASGPQEPVVRLELRGPPPAPAAGARAAAAGVDHGHVPAPVDGGQAASAGVRRRRGLDRRSSQSTSAPAGASSNELKFHVPRDTE